MCLCVCGGGRERESSFQRLSIVVSVFFAARVSGVCLWLRVSVSVSVSSVLPCCQSCLPFFFRKEGGRRGSVLTGTGGGKRAGTGAFGIRSAVGRTAALVKKKILEKN